MGRAVRFSSDSLVERSPRKSRIVDRSTKKYKKRKPRRELNDIHRKITKAEDALRLQDAQKKATNGTKEKGAKPPARISNRILPRPSGIYRNGARSKDIRKVQRNLSAKDLDDARLVSDVFRLVNAAESATQYVQQAEASTARKSEISPIIGRTDRKKEEDKRLRTPENVLSQEGTAESEEVEPTPENTYQQLCSSIVSKNFAEANALINTVPDPLGIAVAKVRNVYASTFSSSCLRQKIREGINLADPQVPALKTSSTNDRYFTWMNCQMPESAKVLPRCSVVDTETPLRSSGLRRQYDNRQMELSEIIVEETPETFHAVSNEHNQCVEAPVKKKGARRSGSSSGRESTVTETIREMKAGKHVIYRREVKDESRNIQQLVINRTKADRFRTSDNENFQQLSQEASGARNPSVQHEPMMLRRKKIVQTLESDHSNVRTRSRRVKEAEIFEGSPEERYLVRQGSFIPVETPRIINEMYESVRSRNQEQLMHTMSQDSFLSTGYQTMGSSGLPRGSSYNFLPVRTIDKPETITARPPQHHPDVLYVSRNSCLGNCSHASQSYQMQAEPPDPRQIGREMYVQQHMHTKSRNPRAHQYQEDVRLCGEEFMHRKPQKERNMCKEEHCADHYMLRTYKDHPHCSTDNLAEYSKVQKPSSQVDRRFHRESSQPEAGILDGVGKLQILNDEWEEARPSRHGNRPCNSTILFTDSTQPVKYLAGEDTLQTRRIPIYQRETSCPEASRKPKRNHHSTCVQVNQSYMLVPACDQAGKVLYVKPGALHCSDLARGECSRSHKIVYQEDDPRKRHGRRERKNECDGSYTLVDGQNVQQLMVERRLLRADI